MFKNIRKHANSNFFFNFTISQNKFVAYLEPSTTTTKKTCKRNKFRILLGYSTYVARTYLPTYKHV